MGDRDDARGWRTTLPRLPVAFVSRKRQFAVEGMWLCKTRFRRSCDGSFGVDSLWAALNGCVEDG
jgi:hypothetical protein